METFRHGETIKELLDQENAPRKVMYLNEISLLYRKWKKANVEITTNKDEDLKKKIALYKDYRSFLFSKKFREEATFLKNRKLFETALSEFLYYILKDLSLFKDPNFYLGRAELPNSFRFEFGSATRIKGEKILDISRQKMRLVIGRQMDLKYRIKGRKSYTDANFVFPLVVISSAMIMDEWFLHNLQNQVRRFKNFFPRSLFLGLCEVVNHDLVIDKNALALDGIYVLQRQTTKMKRRDISFDVVKSLLRRVEGHLEHKKEDFIAAIEQGIIGN